MSHESMVALQLRWAQHELRVIDKAHIKFRQPNLCPHCGLDTAPDAPRYTVRFRDRFLVAKSFAEACASAAYITR